MFGVSFCVCFPVSKTDSEHPNLRFKHFPVWFSFRLLFLENMLYVPFGSKITVALLVPHNILVLFPRLLIIYYTLAFLLLIITTLFSDLSTMQNHGCTYTLPFDNRNFFFGNLFSWQIMHLLQSTSPGRSTGLLSRESLAADSNSIFLQYRHDNYNIIFNNQACYIL